VRSLLDLMDAGVSAPDHTTLARRRRTVAVDMRVSAHTKPTDIVLDSTGLKFYGAGEWARQKHGETRCSWRKLHIFVDPATSEIVAHELTDDDTSDTAMAGPLVAGSGGLIRRVFADGAYDGAPVTAAIRVARPPRSPPKIIVPPQKQSIPPPGQAHSGTERECHVAEIGAHGRRAWQKNNDYGLRSLVETGVSRIKGIVKVTPGGSADDRSRASKQGRRLSCGNKFPFRQGGGSVPLVGFAVDDVTFAVEVIVQAGMDGGEFLQGLVAAEPAHGALASSEGLVRVFDPVVQPLFAPLSVLHAEGFERRAIRAEPVGDDLMRAAVTLQGAAQKSEGCLAVPGFRGIDFQHLALAIDGAPEVVLFPVDTDEHLIKMPSP
jgi:hypothetical protein